MQNLLQVDNAYVQRHHNITLLCSSYYDLREEKMGFPASKLKLKTALVAVY
jgi:hypothetical protein